ncbi:MAG: hypothetical protein A2Y97_07125 [Nitrospirae bacterium RBG_13_39_12]|nr:MAG: hypothetical protein A2Y97_07125 [Nitrospirae bacterium RBG_13_39_12]
MTYFQRADAQMSAILVHEGSLMHNYYTYYCPDAHITLNIVHDASLMHNRCAYKSSNVRETEKNVKHENVCFCTEPCALSPVQI